MFRLTLALTLLFTLGCADLMQSPPPPEPVVVETPEERAARIVAFLSTNPPDKGEALLKAEGLTDAELEELLYEIAKDANRSKAFDAAR